MNEEPITILTKYEPDKQRAINLCKTALDVVKNTAMPTRHALAIIAALNESLGVMKIN